MASKKDLIEAQAFSRRRLLTAFTSGAPGGKELEPAKPLRGVVAGLALTALIVVGGLFYGMVRPGLPEGWDHNRLVVAEDTGARYISFEGTLHPVLNTASARLLVASGELAVVTTGSERLADAPLGAPVGIVGAPDQLPPADRLVGTGWTSCVAPGEGGTPLTTTLSATPVATATDAAVVVRAAGSTTVVVDGSAYPVDPAATDAVLRALGLGDAAVRDVPAAWLNLFDPGTTLAAVVVRDAGDPVAGTGLQVGQVVHTEGSPADARYLVQEDGSLAPIRPLAYQLYLLGTGSQLGEARDVPPAEIADLPTATTVAGGADWPEDEVTGLDDDAVACALATDEPGTVLASAGTGDGTDEVAEAGAAAVAVVDPGAGALVRASGRGDQGGGGLYLVDATGTAFPVADDAETVARLGYTADELGEVTRAWIALLPTGPALSTEAAGSGVLADPATAVADPSAG